MLGVLTALSVIITCLDCDKQYEEQGNESHNIYRKHRKTKKSSRRKSSARKELKSNCGVENEVIEPQKHQAPSQMGLSQMVGSQMGLFAQPRRPSLILINPPVVGKDI